MGSFNAGRVATVVTAPPPGADPSSTPVAPNGVRASIVAGGMDIEGRLSLGMLAALVAAAVLFYYWTRTAQGGG